MHQSGVFLQHFWESLFCFTPLWLTRSWIVHLLGLCLSIGHRWGFYMDRVGFECLGTFSFSWLLRFSFFVLLSICMVFLFCTFLISISWRYYLDRFVFSISALALASRYRLPTPIDTKPFRAENYLLLTIFRQSEFSDVL